jgi:hypothetical protein
MRILKNSNERLCDDTSESRAAMRTRPERTIKSCRCTITMRSPVTEYAHAPAPFAPKTMLIGRLYCLTSLASSCLSEKHHGLLSVSKTPSHKDHGSWDLQLANSNRHFSRAWADSAMPVRATAGTSLRAFPSTSRICANPLASHGLNRRLSWSDNLVQYTLNPSANLRSGIQLAEVYDGDCATS